MKRLCEDKSLQGDWMTGRVECSVQTYRLEREDYCFGFFEKSALVSPQGPGAHNYRLR